MELKINSQTTPFLSCSLTPFTLSAHPHSLLHPRLKHFPCSSHSICYCLRGCTCSKVETNSAAGEGGGEVKRALLQPTQKKKKKKFSLLHASLVIGFSGKHSFETQLWTTVNHERKCEERQREVWWYKGFLTFLLFWIYHHGYLRVWHVYVGPPLGMECWFPV